MKIKQILLAVALLSTAPLFTQAQKKVVQDTLIVEGICGMCKTRIEEAAFGKGVKFVQWTNATSELAVAYRSDKTSIEEIEDRVVNRGHSTENKKARKEDYDALPDCCRYEHMEKH